MPLYAIILIIVLGISLLLVEFFLVPGITIAGIAGLLVMGVGVYASYAFHPSSTGNIVLFSTLAANMLTIAIAFRSRTWQKMGLSSSIESKNITFDQEKIKAGDQGQTLTRMNPMGKIQVNEIICEAKTQGDFLNPGQHIVVTKVTSNQIIVKPINNE